MKKKEIEKELEKMEGMTNADFDIYEDPREIMKKMTLEATKSHIYILQCHASGPQKIKELEDCCPHFSDLGFLWIFVVDLSEIAPGNPHVGIITTEIAKRWFPRAKNKDELLSALQDWAFFNMSCRLEHLKGRNLNPEASVPLYEMYLDDAHTATSYATSYMILDEFLLSMHERMGDFYIFPRFRSKFFVVSEEDVKKQEKSVLEIFYGTLLSCGYLKLPLPSLLSEKALYCDSEKVRVLT